MRREKDREGGREGGGREGGRRKRREREREGKRYIERVGGHWSASVFTHISGMLE